MYGNNRYTLLITVGMTTGLLLSAPAWTTDLMVLESNVATLPVADVVDSDMPISLPKGAEVVLVDDAGNEYSLRGPFDGLPIPADGSESFMVLDSDLDALPVAEVVEAGAEVDIPAGNRVVLVSETGHELVLDGPFQGVPSFTAPDDGLEGGSSVGATRSMGD